MPFVELGIIRAGGESNEGGETRTLHSYIEEKRVCISTPGKPGTLRRAIAWVVKPRDRRLFRVTEASLPSPTAVIRRKRLPSNALQQSTA